MIKRMLKRFRNIKLRPLLIHMIITLAYPAARAYVVGGDLLLFTDAMTIIALVMVIGGIAYSTYLHGDYDISGFVFRRGRKQQTQSEHPQSFQDYMADKKEKREASFNYPLFLGIAYILVALLISYVFL